MRQWDEVFCIPLNQYVSTSVIKLIIFVLYASQLPLYTTNSLTITPTIRLYRYKIANRICYSQEQTCYLFGTTCSKQNIARNNHNHCQLHAVESKSEVANQSQQLSDRFGRWKYLQYILDEDESINDNVNYILFSVLSRWIRERPQDDDNVIPSSTYEIITNLLNNSKDEQKIPVVILNDINGNNNLFDSNVLGLLEQLLPDPQDDEDAYKSLWDTVIELHGREAVKINERSNSSDWKARCTIARGLLHFDFLTEGI